MSGTNSRGERPSWESHKAPFRAKGTDWSQTRAGSPLKRLVSQGRSSASSNLRFRRSSPSSRIWIGGLPGCLTSQAQDIQPHLSHSQDHKVRTLPPPKRPAPALTPLVSYKKPKQNPQPTGRGRGKFKGKGQFSGQSTQKGKGRGAKGPGRS